MSNKRAETIALEITKKVGGDKRLANEILALLNQNFVEGYTELAARTDTPDERDAIVRASNPTVSRLLHAGMGMVTEAGEFMGTLKAHIRYGKEIDIPNLIEELGDIEWYVAHAIRTLKSSYGHVHATNINKLMKRFPEKFTNDKAINRDLKAERESLENDTMANTKRMSDT